MSFLKRLYNIILSWFRFKPPEEELDDFDFDRVPEISEDTQQQKENVQHKSFKVHKCKVVSVKEINKDNK